MITNSDRAARERLAVCLARLAAFKQAELVQTDAESRYFAVAFSLRAHPGPVPPDSALQFARPAPDRLNVVADDAERTLAQFREIFSFNGEGVENPKQVSAAMISAVRDAYPPIYEKLSPLIEVPVSEPEVERKPKRRGAVALVAVALAGAIIIGVRYAGYHYTQYTGLTDKVLGALR